MDNIEKRPDDWLTPLELQFNLKGYGGQDFFYVIQTVIDEKRHTFKSIVEDAAVGCGCVVHEGLGYSLDQDWDNPSLFDEVVFYIGNYETTALSVKDYFSLLLIAINAYVASYPEDKEELLKNYNIAIERLRRFL